MSPEEQLFIEAGNSIAGAERGQLFGKTCFKHNGKAFCCFFQQCMVFKLSGELHKEALSLDGAQLFDPSGKGRPMKEWVQVPYAHQQRWAEFAAAAAESIE